MACFDCYRSAGLEIGANFWNLLNQNKLNNRFRILVPHPVSIMIIWLYYASDSKDLEPFLKAMYRIAGTVLQACVFEVYLDMVTKLYGLPLWTDINTKCNTFFMWVVRHGIFLLL